MGALRDTFDLFCCMSIDHPVNQRLLDETAPSQPSKRWLIISLLIAVTLFSLVLVF